MKNIFFIIFLILFTSTIYSQQTQIPKTEEKGDLKEVTIYYDNGGIMQHGFYTKSGKLHGGWESYNSDGTRKCVAFYNKGVKVGAWYYWNKGIQTKVVYDNNKIISVEKVNSDSISTKKSSDN
jgi:antitoxin component YwqK of YwqJK toxin-antitoxin module